jgi:hypothetical protein
MDASLKSNRGQQGKQPKYLWLRLLALSAVVVLSLMFIDLDRGTIAEVGKSAFHGYIVSSHGIVHVGDKIPFDWGEIIVTQLPSPTTLSVFSNGIHRTQCYEAEVSGSGVSGLLVSALMTVSIRDCEQLASPSNPL